MARNVGWLEVWGTEPRQSEGYIWHTRKEAEACARSDPGPSRIYRINLDWTLDLVFENLPARLAPED